MIAPNESAPPTCPKCGAELLAINKPGPEPVHVACSLHPFEHYGHSTQIYAGVVIPSHALPKSRPGPWERAFAKGWRAFERSVADHMEVIERPDDKGRPIINARWSPMGDLVGRDVSFPPHELDPLNVLYVDYANMLRDCHLPPLPFGPWKARYLAVQARRAG